MRYLFGDSAPFPPQYDFLAALDVFCSQAARLVRADAEARSIRRTVLDATVTRARGIDQLDAFHREAVGALRDGAEDEAEALVSEYVQRVSELAQRLVDDARRAALVATDGEQRGADAECEKRRVEVKDALERVLIAVRLPVSETKVTLTLNDGRNDLTAVFSYEIGAVAAFTLGGDGLLDWQLPKRVGDFAKGVTLPVGVRRSLFKRTVAPETITLDEYIIGSFDLEDDRAGIRLRKRPDHPDSLVFSIKRVGEDVSAEVHHPDDTEAEEGLAPVLDAASAGEVERLWHLLRAACSPALAHKQRLVRLLLGSEEVFAVDAATKVVSLIVNTIAPIVGEVARRSPNPHELSLKVEDDTGRRQEIYLKKGQLESVLATVSPGDRAVFDPLGIVMTSPARPAA